MSNSERNIGIRYSEQFVDAIGIRYGFRRRDYCLIWDGGDFQGCRNVHELTVETVDGRSFTAEIEDAALSRRDAWPYMRYIDAGFRALARRSEPRGL